MIRAGSLGSPRDWVTQYSLCLVVGRRLVSGLAPQANSNRYRRGGVRRERLPDQLVGRKCTMYLHAECCGRVRSGCGTSGAH